MGSYQEHALEGASAVDLVVALYDGMIRFLYAAMMAVERGDQEGRRAAVKRVMDIIIHLQAIECVRNVRDAWRQVAVDPDVNPAPLQMDDLPSGPMRQDFAEADYGMESAVSSRWNA